MHHNASIFIDLQTVANPSTPAVALRMMALHDSPKNGHVWVQGELVNLALRAFFKTDDRLASFDGKVACVKREGGRLTLWCDGFLVDGPPCEKAIREAAQAFLSTCKPLVKRVECYVMKPAVYEIASHGCGHTDPEWSEYEGHLWCPACEIDFKPKHHGVFDGPIPLHTAEMMGMRFERVNVSTGQIVPVNLEESQA